MNDLFSLLPYILPSVVVFLTAYYLLMQFLKNERLRRLEEMRIDRTRTTLPIRLQAYERIILLLERIAAENLVMRVLQPGMTVQNLQQAMLHTVREEFSHNLSQQLYVSSGLWALVRNAKEETLGQINASASLFDPKANASELAGKLIAQGVDKPVVPGIIEALKAEASKLF